MQLKFSLLTAITVGLTFIGLARAETPASYDGSSVEQVWSQLTSDPYLKPANKVTVSRFFRAGASLIQRAADRTISEREDLLPRFDKLVHANGICLKGTWSIDQDSAFSGYFAAGSKALIIARASVAFSDTDRGSFRSFGLAGKLFPTQSELEEHQTANFFTIDDLGGQKSESFLDVGLTNEPAISVRPSTVLLAPLAAAVSLAFSRADRNPNIRQLYEVAELGVSPGDRVVTPKWMRLSASAGQGRTGASDFRDELDPRSYEEESLTFDIEVASDQLVNRTKQWQTIGQIEFTESVVSDSCDHRLHFHHPKFRDDVVHH